MKTSALRTRVQLGILLTTFVVYTAGVSLSLILIYRYVESLALERIRAQEAVLESEGVIEQISRSPIPQLHSLFQDRLEELDIHEIVRVYRTDGELIFTNSSSSDINTSIIDRVRFVNRGPYLIEGRIREYLARLKAYRTSDAEEVWVEVATARPNILSVLKAYGLQFLGILLLGLLFSLLVSRWVANRSLQSLERLAHSIDSADITNQKTWQPLLIRNYPVDFHKIVDKFNELFIRIQQSIIKFQKTGQYIAHEIRTPLTIIQGEIEMSLLIKDLPEAARRKLESATEEILRIDQIVKTLLQQSLLERGQEGFEVGPVDIEDFLEARLPEIEKWVDRTIHFKKQGGPFPKVLSNQGLLFLALSNLVRNAAKHAVPSNKIEICLGQSNENELVLSVADAGKQLTDEDISELQHAEIGNPRLGLGLTLTRQICDLGRIQVQFLRAELGGLEVRLSIPAIRT